MRTTLALAVLLVLVAACRPPIAAGPIDFGADTSTADGSGTLVPVSPTPLPSAAATLTPHRSMTPTLAGSPVAPSPSATRATIATASASPSPTLPADLTPTVSLTPNATPTLSLTPHLTPTVGLTPDGTPTVSLTPTLGATPTLTATLEVTPRVTPTLDVTPTPPPTQLPLGPPGPNALVYQGFWSGNPHGDPENSFWHAGQSWSTALGMLVSDGSAAGPSFAVPAPASPPTGHVGPPMGGGPPLSISVRDYAVEAQFGVTGTHEHSGIGVYLRETGYTGSVPMGFVSPARWRGGIAEGHAFILGEAGVPGATPADLLIAKSVVNTPFTSANEWITIRLEARPHHYTLLIDSRRVLDVDDARYGDGTVVGLWADHAPVRVRDFRVYTLAN